MKNATVADIGNQRGLWARWSLVAFLGIIAASLLVTLGLGAASAQVSTPGGGNSDVFVVAGQISRETYGLYLVDYKNSTICVYQYFPKSRKLHLVVARRYEFDVQLNKARPNERKAHGI